MQLDIRTSFNAQLFTPYSFLDRNYYLLFYKNGMPGPFFVHDSPLMMTTMFHIGDITQGSAEGQVVGTVFHTQSPSKCEGSFILAYSGVLKEAVNSQRAFKPRDLGFELVLKHQFYYLYHKNNLATLAVNPSLKMDIRKNFEV